MCAQPTEQHRTAPHRTAPHRAAPHRTAPHRTAPHRTAPHRIRVYLTPPFATFSLTAATATVHTVTADLHIAPGADERTLPRGEANSEADAFMLRSGQRGTSSGRGAGGAGAGEGDGQQPQKTRSSRSSFIAHQKLKAAKSVTMDSPMRKARNMCKSSSLLRLDLHLPEPGECVGAWMGWCVGEWVVGSRVADGRTDGRERRNLQLPTHQPTDLPTHRPTTQMPHRFTQKFITLPPHTPPPHIPSPHQISSRNWSKRATLT